ncbi:MAG: hypothetical protein QW350_04640 [Candidatus Aenigmatarchaeota archaeon]
MSTAKKEKGKEDISLNVPDSRPIIFRVIIAIVNVAIVISFGLFYFIFQESGVSIIGLTGATGTDRIIQAGFWVFFSLLLLSIVFNIISQSYFDLRVYSEIDGMKYLTLFGLVEKSEDIKTTKLQDVNQTKYNEFIGEVTNVIKAERLNDEEKELFERYSIKLSVVLMFLSAFFIVAAGVVSGVLIGIFIKKFSLPSLIALETLLGIAAILVIAAVVIGISSRDLIYFEHHRRVHQETQTT